VINFGFAIVDFELKIRSVGDEMDNANCFGLLSGNPNSKIHNPKWVGILAFSITLACGGAWAQQPAKIPRIGYLTGSSPPTNTTPDLNADAFRQGLRDLGYVEGKNILVEYRYLEGKDERTSGFLAEFQQLKVDILLVISQPSIQAAKLATKTIPIVMVTNFDPVATGLVDSLAKPGGNITGVTRFTRELSGKRLELLKEIVPKVSRIGILEVATTGRTPYFKDYEPAAHALKIQLEPLAVKAPNPEWEGAFGEMTKRRLGALITARQSLLVSSRKQIADLAIKTRLPLMSEGSDFAESGALASYASDDVANFKRAAVYVDKIVKGAKPADLPVEQPTAFELVFSLKTAKQIGLTIPPEVLARASRLIK
jgi:putative tryptophan/tyrosine transport system substrate-binding protein